MTGLQCRYLHSMRNNTSNHYFPHGNVHKNKHSSLMKFNHNQDFKKGYDEDVEEVNYGSSLEEVFTQEEKGETVSDNGVSGSQLCFVSVYRRLFVV